MRYNWDPLIALLQKVSVAKYLGCYNTPRTGLAMLQTPNVGYLGLGSEYNTKDELGVE